MAFLDSKHQRAALIVFCVGRGAPLGARAVCHGDYWHSGARRPVRAAAKLAGAKRSAIALRRSRRDAIRRRPDHRAGPADRGPFDQPGAGNHADGGPEPDHRANPRSPDSRYPVGPPLAEAGGQIVATIGSSAFGLVGTATRLTLNLTIAFFGLYYVLKHPGDMLLDARPYIPSPMRTPRRLASDSRM